MRGPAWANAIGLAVITLPVAWRRRWPLGILVFLTVGASLQTALLTNVSKPAALIYYLILVPYTAGAWLEQRRAVIGLVLVLAMVSVLTLATGTISDFFFTSMLIIGSWVVGRAARARRLLTIELQEKAARIERERESRARLAIADERTRIARELHAVVANSVSEMVVEAQAAERLLDRDRQAAESAMAHVEERGRQALREMRAILGVLRRDDEGPELAPQPGIGQIPALVEQARAQGLDIELEVEGEPAPLPVGVDLAAYRICATALAALMEHGPGGQGAIVVRYRDEDVELELRDDAPQAGRLDPQEVLRMRERVTMFGGDLTWRERPGGGYEIRVSLPRAYEEVAA
jgi:signal transduction histidine kinase